MKPQSWYFGAKVLHRYGVAGGAEEYSRVHSEFAQFQLRGTRIAAVRAKLEFLPSDLQQEAHHHLDVAGRACCWRTDS